MVTSSINISSAGNPVINTTTSVSSGMPQISSQKIGVSMLISDTDGNQATASLNLNSSSLKLEILNSQEYQKQASLFFGSLFSGGFNAEYMWSLLAGTTNEQINISHLSNALTPLSSDLSALADAFQIHANNYYVHLNQEDRDFLTRLKALYGGVYNVALDYLVLKNPYLQEITLSQNQIALFAGWGGFSAYSGVSDLDIEFYALVEGTYPTKSGGEPTPEAFFANDGTYGYGITTLTIPTLEPEDLIEGEIGLYAGQGGFSAVSAQDPDAEVLMGYYHNGEFYLDSNYQAVAQKNNELIYIDLEGNRIYRYDSEEEEYIPMSGAAEIVSGYYNPATGKFYSEYSNNSYSEEIEGEDSALYVDLLTNTLYRYDGTNQEYTAISSSGDSFIIRGYRNSTDGKFYEDISYTTEITGAINYLYYDFLTSQLYYFKASNSTFDRYHHIIPLDYLLFNTSYTGTIAPSANQIALYAGTGGFNASFLETGETDEVVVGYLYNGSFYSDSEHTTQLVPDSESLYINLENNTLYIYKNGAYTQVSSSGGSGGSLNIGYYYDGNFYESRSGTSPYYTYSTIIPKEEGAVYIDRASGIIYKCISNTYVAQTSPASFSAGPYIVISENTISHQMLTSPISTSSSATYGTVVSTLVYDTNNSSYYGHVSGVTTIGFDVAAAPDNISKRTSDAAIKSSYWILTQNPTMTTALTSGEAALYSGTGGFTATSYAGNNEYYAGTGLLLVNGDTFAVNLNHTSSGNIHGVRADSSGLYVEVTATSGGEGGTTDHNLLTNRFSSDFPSGSVTMQHDIDVITGLRTILNNHTSGLAAIAQSTWSATLPIVYTYTAANAGNNTPTSNVLSLSQLDTAETSETLANGYLLSSASSYVENDSTDHHRKLTKVKVEYSNAITNNTIVKRMSDGALAASYLLITDGVTPSTVPSGSVGLYVGSGGFNSTSANDNYYLYTTFPTTQPSALEDSVISARALFDKISSISGGNSLTLQQVWDSFTANAAPFVNTTINTAHIPIDIVRTTRAAGLTIEICDTNNPLPAVGSRNADTLYIDLNQQ